MDKNAFQLFCEISSIRGMHKITKAPTLFLKFLWISFVFCMTTMLFLVTGLLIKDYLNYYTAWHVRTKFDDNSEFPAITLCSHNPFSIRANKLWKNKNALTPHKFRERLKKMIIDTINSTDSYNDMAFMMFHDKIENYYSNIDYDYAMNISHGLEMLNNCAMFGEGTIVIIKNCESENSDLIERLIFSNQKFFNCWTIQQKPHSFNRSVITLIILVSLTPASDIPELKDAFLMDILERGEGLKLIIHEPNSYPEIEEEGIDVQPGKMNNIKYEPVKWTRYSTPVQKCRNGQPQITDLKRKFNYSFSFCMNYKLQVKLIETCGCMNALFPRPFVPNATIGYCFNLTHENISLIETNIKCAGAFMMEIKELKKNWENTECMQRCDYFTYNTELSITKWVPSYEKLFRITDLINKTEIYMKNTTNSTLKNDYITYIQSNVTDTYFKSDDQFIDFKNENKFTYIGLTRKTRNTVIKAEELVLDLAILMSRIGGLCSLFIGLTVSFFIELVEFGYLICRRQTFLESTTKSSKTIHHNKHQICESINSLYNTPDINTFERHVEENSDEKIDFIEESSSQNIPISNSDIFMSKILSKQNITNVDSPKM